MKLCITLSEACWQPTRANGDGRTVGRLSSIPWQPPFNTSRATWLGIVGYQIISTIPDLFASASPLIMIGHIWCTSSNKGKLGKCFTHRVAYPLMVATRLSNLDAESRSSVEHLRPVVACDGNRVERFNIWDFADLWLLSNGMISQSCKLAYGHSSTQLITRPFYQAL